MTYIQPNVLSSSIMIEGGDYILYDDGAALEVDREFIMDNEDLIFSLYVAIHHALCDLDLIITRATIGIHLSTRLMTKTLTSSSVLISRLMHTR